MSTPSFPLSSPTVPLLSCRILTAYDSRSRMEGAIAYLSLSICLFCAHIHISSSAVAQVSLSHFFPYVNKPRVLSK